MRDKNNFKRKLPHRSTYHTVNHYDQKRHSSSKKSRDEHFDPFIFSPEMMDFDQLTPTQKIIFLLGLGIAIASCIPNQNIRIVDTKQALLPESHNRFFAPQSFNSTTVVPTPPSSQALPSVPLVAKDLSSNLQLQMGIQLRDCQSKSNGVSAGKICLIQGKKHNLKAWGNVDGAEDRYSNILLGMHNLYFIKENIGISIPNIKLIYEKNGKYVSSVGQKVRAEKYLASEFVEDFNNFKDLSRNYTRTVIKANHFRKSTAPYLELEENIRENIIEQIGEEGLAKLAVAGTFIQDLVMNNGNWGIANNTLVVVDADHSPQSLEEYLAEATKMPRNINLGFSIQTLEHMATIYKEMQQKLPIRFHPKVDFNVEDYQFLVDQYLISTNQALEKLKATYPDLPSDKPSKLVNKALSDAFRNQFLEYILNSSPQVKA
ncbi:hypothetical protein BN59_01424 [Legionella massiliensis]|uniref:Uncharacterized protein n=1 Tax=Legionella massiliensis TaxID=1034943 RepID=A0A078KVV7_9GAMM|nr:hypothetical protein [Legionella massiliensis]CDZ77142.1 hypothetical protein BN59_01424 [Legionella massiliensis]CEE12880.1 hypothetical protein BN1094_01424 [Legionella massiliensis]